MNALDIFQKRLHDETATVEQEIQSHSQQLEALNQRLEGFKRAAELFESEQGAISELLQAGSANQSHGKTPAGRATRKASQNSDLTRVDMIAAVLKRYPRRTVRELIALLNKEYRWKTTESAVTNNLYTRRDKFVHTQADRSTNRPVTWSLK